ncbi:MAG TPA: PIN domain-containing protein [Verrucomicrobiae bacterium]|nr:PIN domain-containing protein [Verrucomicrobiae bacterium]
MTAECFLDANVLVYAVSKAPAEANKKKRALELIEEEDFGVSTQILQEFYVTTTRKLKQPIPPEDALKFIRSLAAFPLVPVDLALIQRGAALSQRYQISYWDGAVLAAAERLSAKTVFSEDMSHGQRYGSVTVVNPFRS